MFQNLDVFKTAMSLASHAGLKQAVTAQNVANSDTPGYRSKAVKPFNELFQQTSGGFELRTTRTGHIGAMDRQSAALVGSVSDSDPNGNSVAIETEILNSVDAKRQHDRALAVYRASLGMLRSTLSKQ